MGDKDKSNKASTKIDIKSDGYEISLKGDRLVVRSAVPVEVESAPAISNGVDEMVSKSDFEAAKAARLNQKWSSKGHYYEGQGVYLGKYNLKSPEDCSLSLQFHAFAAKRDYPYCLDSNNYEGVACDSLYSLTTANDSLANLARAQKETIFDNSGLRNVGGASVKYAPVPRIDGRCVMPLRDGIMCDGRHSGLWQIVKDNAYKGQWFIPTMDMLETLLAPNFDKKHLKDSFNMSSQHFDFPASIYLSSSFGRGVGAEAAFDLYNNLPVDMSDQVREATLRLVRLVPCE